MPKPNEIVMGKAWGLWVTDAARALIAATTPERRLAILRGGFFTFQQACKGGFAAAMNCPFSFNSAELRWMFRMLGRQVDQDIRRNPQMERDFENRRSRKQRERFEKGEEEAAAIGLSDDHDMGLIEVDNYDGRRGFTDRGRRTIH